MRRPNYWLQGLLFLCVLLVIAEYAALTWLVPRYVIHVVEHATGGKLSIGDARLSLPLTTTLTRLGVASDSAASSLNVQRVIIRARWCSFPTRTLWLDAVEIERPLLRLTKQKTGAVVWPGLQEFWNVEMSQAAGAAAGAQVKTEGSSWRVHIDSIKIIDGLLDFVDEQPASPFHASLDHVSLVMGPVTVPFDGARLASLLSGLGEQGMSWAFRAEIIGHQGEAAPVYSSGWLDLAAKDLQASFQLEPLDLAVFEPYAQGPSELRLPNTTLRSTSQWWAKANQFNSRMQLELEGEVSFRGRTLLDIKKTGGRGAQLSGEVSLTGLLDKPKGWHAEFRPGNELVQQMIKHLLDRDMEIIKVPFLGRPVRLSLTPTSKATMTDIQATSHEVQEALEMLAFPAPPPEQAPAAGVAAAPVPSAAPPIVEEAPAAAVEQPAAPSEPSPPPTPPLLPAAPHDAPPQPVVPAGQ